MSEKEVTVLHVHNNADPRASGTAAAMWRIHSQLIADGIKSSMMCAKNADRFDGAAPVPAPERSVIRKSERRLRELMRNEGLNSVISFRASPIMRSTEYQRADVLHFHTIHNSIYSYLSLPRLTRARPAVYTLHDMWPMTGHCTFSYECERWKTGCGECPHPDTYPPIKKDRTRLEWRMKGSSVRRSKLILAAPSRWMADIARHRFGRHITVLHIPNGLDLNVYRPQDKHGSKVQLGLPSDKTVLLSGAVNLRDHRKGGDMLVRAINSLSPSVRNRCCLALMGRNAADLRSSLQIETVDLGFLDTDHSKVAAYSGADLFIFPTRADNNPLMIIESIACGTPVISFGVGGVAELVRPATTGVLASAEDTAGLAEHITTLVNRAQYLRSLSSSCVKVAEKEFDIKLTVSRYLEAYSRLLQDSANSKLNHSD